MGRTKLESKLKNRILDLIESPELHAYLMEHAERLKLKDYVSIIAGAPISLGRKQELLHDMKRSSCLKKQEMDYVSLCCACMDRAVQFLTSETGTIFLIQLMGYDDKHKSDIMDGPYIMTSLANTKNAVKNYYREDMDEDGCGMEDIVLAGRIIYCQSGCEQRRRWIFISRVYLYYG